MNECIKELANITRIQNIQLVRTICKDKGWDPEEMISQIVNKRNKNDYKLLFDSIVEDELNNSFKKTVLYHNDVELEPYILGDNLYYIDKKTTNIYAKDLIPIDIKLQQIITDDL